MNRREFIAVIAGAAIASPLDARAQPKEAPTIGVLASIALTGGGLQQGLGEAGYIEGENLAVKYRVSNGLNEQLPAMAADLVRRKVGLIAAVGTEAARAAKSATSTIPIVFLSEDPVAEGLVTNLARPGGNLTGISEMDAELMSKRLDLLSQLVPQAKAFALLVNRNAPSKQAVIRGTRNAARQKGVRLHVLEAFTQDEIAAAFRDLPSDAGGLVVDDATWWPGAFIANLAARRRVPAIYDWTTTIWVGGLIAYGPSRAAEFRQIGEYVGKILKGAKPSNLPVMQPARFQLLVNLKAAKALGITVPRSLLAQADEINQ